MRLALAIQTPDVPAAVPVALLSGSLEQKLAKAAAWGADGVELMTSHPAELNARQVSALCQRHSLEVAAVASGAVPMAAGLTLLHADPSLAEQARLRLHELIAFAGQVGAPLVTIGGFRGRLAWGGEGARQKLADILRQAADDAGAHSVRLALEALNRYESDIINNHVEGLAFLDEINHPALGLLLDTFHLNIEEASYTEPFRRALQAGKLFHVHLGDNNRLPPGRGRIDFPAIIDALRAGGYAGYLSAELLAKPDPDSAARDTLTYMRPLLERET
jgi:sugar phosphate isomerase/epimerase